MSPVIRLCLCAFGWLAMCFLVAVAVSTAELSPIALGTIVAAEMLLGLIVGVLGVLWAAM